MVTQLGKTNSTVGISFYSPKPTAYPYDNLDLFTFRWKDVNPSEGVFNWTILQNELNKRKPFYIRMEISDSLHVPQWLFAKYPDLKSKQFVLDPYTDNFNISSPGKFIPLWHAGVESKLNELLLSFKSNNFGSNSNLHSAYFPGAWKWGEYGRIDYTDLEAQGLTPSTYVAWFKRLVDSFVDAYNGNANKLMFTGGDILENDGGTVWRDGVGRQPSAYAIQKGMGARTGLLEKYNFIMTDLPNYGTSVISIGGKNYMITNDNNPLISDSTRIWSNENEEFCYGSNPCDKYHYKMSVLKQLQLRQNWMYSNQTNWNIDIPLNTYFYQVAGKRLHNAPDAWCVLREAKDVYQYWANYPK